MTSCSRPRTPLRTGPVGQAQEYGLPVCVGRAGEVVQPEKYMLHHGAVLGKVRAARSILLVEVLRSI
jgi:hypothetical protein